MLLEVGDKIRVIDRENTPFVECVKDGSIGIIERVFFGENFLVEVEFRIPGTRTQVSQVMVPNRHSGWEKVKLMEFTKQQIYQMAGGWYQCAFDISLYTKKQIADWIGVPEGDFTIKDAKCKDELHNQV
jgi:hypothetical protein